jgi:hypothetical protein
MHIALKRLYTVEFGGKFQFFEGKSTLVILNIEMKGAYG